MTTRRLPPLPTPQSLGIRPWASDPDWFDTEDDEAQPIIMLV